MSTVDEAAQAYIDGIAPQNRPLFDRLHGLILRAYPDAAVGLSYGMPAYTVGGRRFYVAAWKHGLSIYGWPQGREAASPPAIRSSRRARGPFSSGPAARPASATGSCSS